MACSILHGGFHVVPKNVEDCNDLCQPVAGVSMVTIFLEKMMFDTQRRLRHQFACAIPARFVYGASIAGLTGEDCRRLHAPF